MNVMQKVSSRIVLAGLLATLGVGLTGVGEFLLHYAPGGWGEARRFAFLETVSPRRAAWGHFLAVLTAPSYFLGYWHVTQGLRPAPIVWRRIFLGVSIYVFTVASVWLGSRAWLAKVVQARASTPSARDTFDGLIADYHFLLESLLWAVRGGVLLLSVLFVGLVVMRRTAYPRWFAVFNPIVLLVVVFATLLVPALGAVLVPAAMNVVHVVFFGLSTYLLATRRSFPNQPENAGVSPRGSAG